jgi:hypothetical protein
MEAEVQESQPEGEEVPVEAAVEENEFKKQLEEEKKARQEAEAKYKNTSSLLTKTQQDYSELLRFQKAIIPKINKTFDEEWSQDPQAAVQTQVNTVKEEIQNTANKTQQELAYLKAMQWMNQVVAENPEKAKLMGKVREIGSSHLYGQLTFSEEGIRELFDIAEVKEFKENGARPVQMEKKSTYTEGSAPVAKGNGQGAQKIRLTPTQRRVASQMGLSDEQYLKGMGYLDAVKQTGTTED